MSIEKEVLKNLEERIGKEYSIENFKSRSFFPLFKRLTESFYNGTKSKIDMYSEFRLSFGYIDSMKINACAFHVDKVDFVMINMGCILYIFDYYHKLLGKPKMFTNIGTPNKEEFTITFPPSVDKNRIKFHNGAKDIDRRDYANFMGYISLRFLIYHELGHHYNGHMLYRNKLYKENNINQIAMLRMANKANDDVNPLEYQAIEMDADAFASTQSIIDLIDMYERKTFNSFAPNIYKYIDNYEKMLNVWSYSIYSFFLLLEDEKTNIENLCKYKYLPKIIRQIKNANILYKVLKYQYPNILANLGLDESGIENLFIDNAIKAEADFAKVKQVKDRSDDVMLIKDKRLQKHIEVVDNEWEILRPKLEQYSRGILYTKNKK